MSFNGGTARCVSSNGTWCATLPPQSYGGPYSLVMDFGGRYDAQLIDFARMVRGEIENPFGYDHELAVERTLLRACGVPFVEQR